jgi:AraC-like DNA-binding protein
MPYLPMMMTRADLAAFLEMPIGRFHCSMPLFMWGWSPSLIGIAHIGAITTADLPLLRSAACLPFHPGLARPYRAVVDASRLTHLDPEVFAYLVEHLRAIRAEGSSLVSKVCIVRPPGLHGAAALGLAYEHLNTVIEARFFDHLDEALAEAAEPQERAALAAELEHLYGAQPLVERVRRELDELPNLAIATMAARIGTSVRTLQRALAFCGTNYRVEAARSRLQQARRLLMTSDEPLDAIAQRSGYGSASTLSRRIRATYGTRPRALRNS